MQQQQSAASQPVPQQWISASQCGYSFPSSCVDCVTASECPEPSCSTSDELTSLCTDQCIVVACSDPEHSPNIHSRCDLGYDSTPPCVDCDEIHDFLQCCYGLNPCFVDQPRPPQQSQNQRGRGHHHWDASLTDALCNCEHTPELRSYYPSTRTTLSSAFLSPPHGGPSQSTQPTPTSTAFSLVQPYTSIPQQYSPVVPTDAYHLGGSPYSQPQDQPQLPQTESPTAAPLTCMWGNCQMQFKSLSDLVGHVNLAHLRHHSEPLGSQTNNPSSLAQNCDDKMPCLWGNCTEYLLPPLSSGGASLAGLVNHLFQDHLGLHPSHGVGQYGNQQVDCMLAEMTAPQLSEQSRFQAPQQIPYGQGVSGSPNFGPVSNFKAVAQRSREDKPYPNIPPQDASSSATSSPQTVASTISSAASVGEAPSENTHVCLWEGCRKSFETCNDLTTHISAAHVGSGKPQYDCLWEGCMRNGDKGFSSKQKICRHLQSHTGYRPFQCPDCLQNFSEAATLQQHRRRHTQEKPYKCDFPGCGKSFAITGALTIHKRVHNGQKPFKCAFCGRGFAESSNLSKHLRTHTGERPYVCSEPNCGKTFARPDQLTRHMNVHRKKAPEIAV